MPQSPQGQNYGSLGSYDAQIALFMEYLSLPHCCLCFIVCTEAMLMLVIKEVNRKMQMPANGGEFEPRDARWMNPMWNSGLTSFRSMRLLRLSPIRVETGGTKRLNKKVDWDTLVDAIYAPKSKFSPN